MALSKLTFDPATGWNDTTAFPTTPDSETDVRERLQELHDQTRVALNGLVDELAATTDGTSGADGIGVTAIAGWAGATAQAVLESAKTAFDGLVAGEIDPSSILTAGAINDTGMFADDVVTGAKIAADTIDSEHYAAGSIDAEHLASASVTEAKIDAGAVTVNKIGTGAVTEAKIGTGAVTSAKVSPGHVVGARFGRTDGTSQTITHETSTAVEWTTWPYDPDTSKDGTYPSRMVCKYAGVYTIDCSIWMYGTTTGTSYNLYLKKNGTTNLAYKIVGGFSGISCVLDAHIDCCELAVDDYIEVIVYQSSGDSASKTVRGLYGLPILSMRRNMF